jgi:hypothetical protein
MLLHGNGPICCADIVEGKHLNKERSPLREHEIRDVEAPTYRKANTKCYANIASAVIEHERRYDAL